MFLFVVFLEVVPFHTYDGILISDLYENIKNKNVSFFRVNFLKYQKPEKKINTNSDVFRIVHNMDKEPKQGIAARPEKIMAEEDIRSVRFFIK